jgi:WD40 repeat protein
VIGDYDGRIKVYDSEKLTLVTSFQAHYYLCYGFYMCSAITRIKQSPFIETSNYVATCSYDSKVKIWNSLKNWTLVQTYTGHNYTAWLMAMDWINANTIASGGYYEDLSVKIWSISSGKTLRIIKTDFYVSSLKTLSNGVHLAVGFCPDLNKGDYNGKIKIYNVNTGELVSTLLGHGSFIWGLERLKSGNLLASSSSSPDTTIKIWDLTTNKEKSTLSGHTSSVYELKQVSADVLASASTDYTIRLWNTTSGKLMRTLTDHKNSIYPLDILNGVHLVSGSRDKTIKIWNWSQGVCLNTIQTDSIIFSLAVV